MDMFPRFYTLISTSKIPIRLPTLVKALRLGPLISKRLRWWQLLPWLSILLILNKTLIARKRYLLLLLLIRTLLLVLGLLWWIPIHRSTSVLILFILRRRWRWIVWGWRIWRRFLLWRWWWCISIWTWIISSFLNSSSTTPNSTWRSWRSRRIPAVRRTLS